MKNDYQNSFFTFLALTRRNVGILHQKLLESLVDSLILTSINVLLFGYLFPTMGMSSTLVAPVFLGSLISMFFNLGFSLAIRSVFDLKFERFIDYQLTLPITTTWLFASYAVAYFIELFVSTTPTIAFGLFALRSKISFAQADWMLFSIIYILILSFFSLLFLAISFLYNYTWFLDNVWPRRLTPLIVFGSVYAPWYRINEISRPLGMLLLCNPITYVSEGLRSSLLGDPRFLSPGVCIGALTVSIGLAIVLLIYSVKKQLNPV